MARVAPFFCTPRKTGRGGPCFPSRTAGHLVRMAEIPRKRKGRTGHGGTPSPPAQQPIPPRDGGRDRRFHSPIEEKKKKISFREGPGCVSSVSDRASTYHWAGRSPLVSWQDVCLCIRSCTRERPAQPHGPAVCVRAPIRDLLRSHRLRFEVCTPP